MTCAAGSDTKDWQTAVPGPCLDVLAEAKAYLAITIAIFHDQTANQSVRRGLEMVLN